MVVFDKVEVDFKVCVFVIMGEGKFYFNGLSLSLEDRGLKENMQLIDQFYVLLKRIFIYLIFIVVVVNGYVVVGGCMVVFVYDYRFMWVDRGFMFFSEIDIKFFFFLGEF